MVSHICRVLPIALLAAFLHAGAPLASAAVIPLFQQRFVAVSTVAQTTGGPAYWGSESLLSPDFGSFDAQAHAATSAAPRTDPPLASAHSASNARQLSKIDHRFISAQGHSTLSQSATASTLVRGSALGESTSYFDLYFMLVLPCLFLLEGATAWQAAAAGADISSWAENEISFTRVDASEPVFQALNSDQSFTCSGVLEPGTYQLRASSTVAGEILGSLDEAKSAQSSSSFHFTLTLTPVFVPDSAVGLTGLALIFGALLAAGRERKSMALS